MVCMAKHRSGAMQMTRQFCGPQQRVLPNRLQIGNHPILYWTHCNPFLLRALSSSFSPLSGWWALVNDRAPNIVSRPVYILLSLASCGLEVLRKVYAGSVCWKCMLEVYARWWAALIERCPSNGAHRARTRCLFSWANRDTAKVVAIFGNKTASPTARTSAVECYRKQW